MKARLLIAMSRYCIRSSRARDRRWPKRPRLERPGGEGTVEVTVQGVSEEQGKVYAAVYISAEGFPDDKEMAHTYAYAPAAEAKDGTYRTDAGTRAGGLVCRRRPA